MAIRFPPASGFSVAQPTEVDDSLPCGWAEICGLNICILNRLRKLEGDRIIIGNRAEALIGGALMT